MQLPVTRTPTNFEPWEAIDLADPDPDAIVAEIADDLEREEAEQLAKTWAGENEGTAAGTDIDEQWAASI